MNNSSTQRSLLGLVQHHADRVQSISSKLNYHKSQYFHVTFKNHVHPPVFDSDALTRGFYCHEVAEGGQPHTHLALAYSDKRFSQGDLVRRYRQWTTQNHEAPNDNVVAHEPDVKVHRTWDTLYGYHHGLSEKESKKPCEAITWLTQAIPLSEHLKSIVSGRKKLNRPETAAKNRYLLETPVNQLVDNGDISVMKLETIYKNQELYKRLSSVVGNLTRDWPLTNGPADITGKRRHVWLFDLPSTGKTAMCRQLGDTCSVYFKDLSDPKYWEGYRGQQFVILNDFHGSISVSSLKTLCDGGSIVPVKGSSATLHPRVVFIVTSNYSLDHCFSKHFETHPIDNAALRERFHLWNASRFYDYVHGELNLIPCSPILLSSCRFHRPQLYPNRDTDLVDQPDGRLSAEDRLTALAIQANFDEAPWPQPISHIENVFEPPTAPNTQQQEPNNGYIEISYLKSP